MSAPRTGHLTAIVMQPRRLRHVLGPRNSVRITDRAPNCAPFM